MGEVLKRLSLYTKSYEKINNIKNKGFNSEISSLANAYDYITHINVKFYYSDVSDMTYNPRSLKSRKQFF